MLEPPLRIASEINRYETRCEYDGSWTVLDIYTSWPADYLGRPLDGIEEADARRLCIVLNALYKYRLRLNNRES